MKKMIAILALSVVVLSATFAQMSVGGGLGYASSKAKYDSDSISYSGFGAYGFVDINYVLFTVGYAKQSNSDYDIDIGYIDIAALGKYPIALGKATIFPMAGFCYNRPVTGIPDGEDAATFTHIGIKAGIGGDISITEKLFVRPTVTFTYFLDNSDEKDYQDAADIKYTVTALDAAIAIGFKL